MFSRWPSLMPTEVEVIAFNAPGRMQRLFETPYTAMETLIDDITSNLEFLNELPYVLFGHSLGSRIAYEFALKLKEKGINPPEHFIASGSRAPHIPWNRPRISSLSDTDFLSELFNMGGTPKEVIHNEQLMALILPMLRADFKIAEEYIGSGDAIFCPITVLAGVSDVDIDNSELTKWEELTQMEFNLKYFAGDHFFIDASLDAAKHISVLAQHILNKWNLNEYSA